MWVVIFTNKKLKPNPTRDANFKPFTRNDYNSWSYVVAIFSHALIWPRWIIGWTCICLGCAAFRIMRIGKPADWPLTGLRFKIANNMCRFFFRCMLLTSGCVQVKKKNVMVDYSEYLGKDYVYRFDGVGVVVPNHICSLDLLTEISLDAPLNCLLGKSEAKKIPFLKWLIDE